MPEPDRTHPVPSEADPAEPITSDTDALNAIHRILAAPDDWSPDTLDQLAAIVGDTGRRIADSVEITSTVQPGEYGWPIAHLTAGPLTVTVYESLVHPGGLCVEIDGDTAAAGLAVYVNDQPLLDVRAANPR